MAATKDSIKLFPQFSFLIGGFHFKCVLKLLLMMIKIGEILINWLIIHITLAIWRHKIYNTVKSDLNLEIPDQKTSKQDQTCNQAFSAALSMLMF